MVAACRAVGLNGDEAHLIRLGENALYRLDTPGVIVRIARSADYLPAVRREVLVSRWLERVGFPAARVLDDVEQPLVVDGHPVTFWYRINEGDRDATYGELSAVLRDLHALAVPDELGLERLPVFGRTAVRIERRSECRRMIWRSFDSVGGNLKVYSVNCASSRPSAPSTGTRTPVTS